jgi:hypothetical protein
VCSAEADAHNKALFKVVKALFDGGQSVTAIEKIGEFTARFPAAWLNSRLYYNRSIAVRNFAVYIHCISHPTLQHALPPLEPCAT